jgi:16S rRNA G1207 methylase RsmC
VVARTDGEMPTSADEGKPWMINKILAKEPASILDLGAGAGTYGQLLRPLLPRTYMTAVEIHAAYLSVPIVEWPQGEMFGNKYERHVHTWQHSTALQLPGVTDWWTGSSIGCYEALSTNQ